MKDIIQIARDPRVELALAALENDQQLLLQQTITIQQIPSPTFEELERASYVEQRFNQLGLEDVYRDEINNVYGRKPGQLTGDPVILSAHIDTVFSADTDLTIRYGQAENGLAHYVYGPGLADNSTGVSGIIAVAEMLKRFELEVQSDVWFIANVGEEGLGNLRGMRQIVEKFGRARAYIVVEGGSFGYIYNAGIGVRRYRISCRTDGGHSWGDFGKPSAVHELARFISLAIESFTVSEKPKSTFNFGVLKGGTSVNTIAASAECLADLRAEEHKDLMLLDEQLHNAARQFRSGSGVAIELELIGDRPMGRISENASLVTAAVEALKAVGCKDPAFIAGSTDANIPLSMNYPAVCVGLARSGNTHSADEFLDVTDLAKGVKQLLLLTLAAAGLDNDIKE